MSQFESSSESRLSFGRTKVLKAQAGKTNLNVTASEKRMLVAQWVSQAWSDFLREEGYIIEQSFVKTGDGSEDHLVKLEGRASQRYTVATPVGPEGEFMFH